MLKRVLFCCGGFLLFFSFSLCSVSFAASSPGNHNKRKEGNGSVFEDYSAFGDTGDEELDPDLMSRAGYWWWGGEEDATSPPADRASQRGAAAPSAYASQPGESILGDSTLPEEAADAKEYDPDWALKGGYWGEAEGAPLPPAASASQRGAYSSDRGPRSIQQTSPRDYD